MNEEITKEAADHEKKLQRVYDAIAFFLQQGKKLTVSAVAAKADVARSTLYTDHPDWLEVLEVIAGKKISPRIALAEVKLTENQKWERQLGLLHSKVAELSSVVKETRNLGDTVYNQLLNELHKYFILAKETPKDRDNKSVMIKETGDLRTRLDAALAEIRQLKAEKGLQGTLLPFAKKETVNVYPADKRSTLQEKALYGYCFDAINTLDHYFKDPEFAPTLVYLMCGQFASGKSRWIKEHKPMHQGAVLYIDGTNHTDDMRSLFVKRLRSLNNNCRIVCCRVFVPLKECLERNQDAARKRVNLTVPEALMRHVDEAFVDVTYNEGFDAIEIVGSYK